MSSGRRHAGCGNSFEFAAAYPRHSIEDRLRNRPLRLALAILGVFGQPDLIFGSDILVKCFFVVHAHAAQLTGHPCRCRQIVLSDSSVRRASVSMSGATKCHIHKPVMARQFVKVGNNQLHCLNRVVETFKAARKAAVGHIKNLVVLAP